MLKVGSGLVWIGATSLAVMWAVPVVQAQSLVELAEREKARRARGAQEGKKTVRVVSEEDLARHRSDGRDQGQTAGAEGQDAGAAESSAESAGSTEGPSAAQEFWRSRLESARKSVEDAEQRVRDSETPARAARGAPTTTRYEDGLADAAERQRIREEFEAAKRDLEAAQRALSELEEEARRAGGL